MPTVGPTVILDIKEYIAKTKERIQNNSYYQKLNINPTVKHSEIANNAIESFSKQELLSYSTPSRLTVNEVRTPQFRNLPKVPQPNIPERPVVNSAKCHTSKISKFVNHLLQAHTKFLPSYIKVTSDFINRMNETKDINKTEFLSI